MKNRTFGLYTHFKDNNDIIHNILYELGNEKTYFMFLDKDEEEVCYTNHVVKDNYTVLNGKIMMGKDDGWYVVKNNVLHCETGPAYCDMQFAKSSSNYKYKYFLNGAEFSFKSWLSWVKGSKHWPEVMANFLGSKSEG